MSVQDEKREVGWYKDDIYSYETVVRAIPSAWGSWGVWGESGVRGETGFILLTCSFRTFNDRGLGLFNFCLGDS